MTTLLGQNPANKNSFGSQLRAGFESVGQTGKDQGFSAVNKTWLSKCLTFDQASETMAKDRQTREDIECTSGDMVPKIVDNKVVLEYLDGRQFTPTDHCFSQIATRTNMGQHIVDVLRENQHPNDSTILSAVISHGLTRLQQAIKNSKRRTNDFLWRTNGNEMRAWLTSKYAIVDNEWYMNILREAIPGGRWSHFRGDSDTLYSNLLIPDTIREEEDSDYGGMLSVGNSEIGIRKLTSLPSVFRVICINGCVWDQEKGEAVVKVHRGKIDLVELRAKIFQNLQAQIPLVTLGIDKLLETRTMKTNVSFKPVVAQLSFDYKLTPKMTKLVLDSYFTELKTYQDQAGSLFGLVNAVTRAGQSLSNADWVRFDGIGGKLVSSGMPGFESLTKRASMLDAKTVDKAFGKELATV